MTIPNPCRFFLFVMAGLFAASQVSAQDIEWRVKDRFRLWDQAQQSERVVTLEQVLDQVRAARGPSDVEHAMLRFLATQPDLYQKAYWQEGEETYSRDFLWPVSYSGLASVPEAAGKICVWTLTGGTVVQDRAPCEALVEFRLPARPRSQAVRASEAGELLVSIDGASPISTSVRIRDRLIASIGDSFASGEGNPDRPMDLTRLARRYDDGEWQTDWSERWVGREPVIGRAGAAAWWDSRCHRSFYSQHMVAALRYAAARPHEATTFVTFACSGAQTFSGLLGRQAQPPGYAGDENAQRLRYPQIEVLNANLCPRPPGGRSRDSTSAEQSLVYTYKDWNGKELENTTDDDEWSWTCTGGRTRRHIDALLVSIGGNDVGFSPVIQGALLPELDQIDEARRIGRAALDFLRRTGARKPEDANKIVVGALPRNYGLIVDRLRQILPPGTPVFQTAYPNPLYDEARRFCGPDDNRDNPSDHPHSRALTALGGFWPDANVAPENRWRVTLTQGEAGLIESNLISPLNTAVRAHVARAGPDWRLVDGFQPAFQGRGWCATNPEDPREGLALPDWTSDPQQSAGSPNTHAWRTHAPQEWDPYRSRVRLFRTPNDAAMTQQPDDPRRRLGWFSWMAEGRLTRQQEALLSSLSGSFHPTFEAHAIMGWSLGESLIETPMPE